MLLENKFLAIGEIGLDLYWEKTSLSLQQEIFTHQIELAIKYELPIVIHVRAIENILFFIFFRLVIF